MKKLIVPFLLTLLAACGDNQIRDAAEVGITAAAQGAQSSTETSKSFTRAEGELIELETGLVNIFPLALERCPGASARSLMFAALDAVLPTAHAHGGGLEAPPGVFDAVGKADGVEQDLGSLGAAEGAYCGLKIALLPVVGEGELSGKSAAVGPCFYADSAGLPAVLAAATPHECWASTVAGASVEHSLGFASPLVVQGANSDYHVHLSVAYNQWFDGLDMDALHAGDAAQLAQLTQNMLKSLSVVTEAH